MPKPIAPEHVATLRRVVEIFRSTIYARPLASPVGDAAIDAALAALGDASSTDGPPEIVRAIFAAQYVRSLDCVGTPLSALVDDRRRWRPVLSAVAAVHLFETTVADPWPDDWSDASRATLRQVIA